MGQAGASQKGGITDFLDAVGNPYIHQGRALGKGVHINDPKIFRQSDELQRMAAIERRAADSPHIFGQIDLPQIFAGIKDILRQNSHAAGNPDAPQTVAMLKGSPHMFAADLPQAVRQMDAVQTAAVPERALGNPYNALRKVNTGNQLVAPRPGLERVL